MTPGMPRRRAATAVASLACAVLASSCSSPQRPPEPEGRVPSLPSDAVSRESAVPALTPEAYRREFARRVAAASPDVFDDPLPEVLRSIVVLEITVDRRGNLAHVAVRRSNGIRALENRALESVRRAAPYGEPAWLARRGEDSVSFLETFLFRDDGRFRIRSLVD